MTNFEVFADHTCAVNMALQKIHNNHTKALVNSLGLLQ